MRKNGRKSALPRTQLHRLARISTLLQKNVCPSVEDILREYREIETLYGYGKGAYSAKTVFRDIRTLRDEFHCPVEFDRASKGYFLTHHGWSFECPTDLSETGMLTLILGAKLAEDIFPDPVRRQVKGAVDEILKGNNPDFLDKSCIRSLKIFAGASALELNSRFPAVFRAWLGRKRLLIDYIGQNGTVSRRTVDPHVLFLYNKEWRIKAYCHTRRAARTFVVSRMRTAKVLDETFLPDMNIIRSVTLDNIVSYRKIPKVKIRLYGNAECFARAEKMHSAQTLVKEKSGDSWLFTIPKVPLEVVVPWILRQGGDAVPLSPPELVEAVREKADTLLDRLKKKPKKRLRA